VAIWDTDVVYAAQTCLHVGAGIAADRVGVAAFVRNEQLLRGHNVLAA
jgi:hypothetical protein